MEARHVDALLHLGGDGDRAGGSPFFGFPIESHFSLGASRVGARLPDSAAGDEQSDDGDEDDELECDAHRVLEAAFQTGA